jgi:hydroxyacylglutathione hydrolase
MKRVADGVWHLNTIPIPNAVNAYLLGDVLVDAGGRRSGRTSLRQLGGHTISTHAITHAHPDHQGSSAELCDKLGIPYWVGERDVDAAENPRLIRERQPNHPIAQLYDRLFTGPGRKVDRALREGDDVAGFRVIDAPGHSIGHVVFWREPDGILVVGDVLTGMDVTTGVRGLHEPKPYLTPDPIENGRSIRKVAALEPKLVLFGHGPPLRDPQKLADFVAGLPQ